MHLAAIRLEEIILVLIFIVLPVLQKLFSVLQKKAREAAAKERRRRSESTLDEPARAAGTGDRPRSASTTDELEPKRGAFWEWLEEQVGEGRAGERRPAEPPPFPRSAGPARGRKPAEPATIEPESFWDELVEEAEFPTARPFQPAAAPPPVPRPRPVAPQAEVRPTYAQISDFRSSSLGALPAAPDEGDVESGLLEHVALTEMSGLADSLPATELGGFSGLGVIPSPALGAGRVPRRRALSPAGGGGTNWRRAVVLAEVLGEPVSLRGSGGFAPGLDPPASQT